MIVQPPPGTRDFLPEDMYRREYVINEIKEVFEKYGFEPLETPAFEYAEVLEGKYGEEEKLIYKFTDRGGRHLALRYDLTVPLARVVARFADLPKPFKRYHISRVWRHEKKQRGRYREFWQCDADIVGAKSLIADAEILALARDVMLSLGFKNFKILINSRKVLRGIAKYVGAAGKEIELCRAIDKLEKIGLEGVKEDMRKRGFSNKIIEKTIELISCKDIDEIKRIEKIKEGKEGIEELLTLQSYLDWFNVEEKYYRFDFCLARGLDYYTGPIFEINVEKPKIGSLAGGGRYDNLIGLFAKQNIPATGISFGIERIIDVMGELRMIKRDKPLTIFVSYATPDVIKDAVKVAEMIRKNGFRATMYYDKVKLRKQLEYADKIKAKVVVIVGKREIEKNEVRIKEMEKRREFTVKTRKLVEMLRNFEKCS